MTTEANREPVNIVAMGIGLSATLVVLYAGCAFFAIVMPKAPLAHGWLQLFSTAPVGSLESLLTGILGSVVFGWVSAAIFTPIYNRLAVR